MYLRMLCESSGKIMWRSLELEGGVRYSAWQPKTIIAWELFGVTSHSLAFLGVTIF